MPANLHAARIAARRLCAVLHDPRIATLALCLPSHTLCTAGIGIKTLAMHDATLACCIGVDVDCLVAGFSYARRNTCCVLVSYSLLIDIYVAGLEPLLYS